VNKIAELTNIYNTLLTESLLVDDAGDGEHVFLAEFRQLWLVHVDLQLATAVSDVLVLHVFWQSGAQEDRDAVDVRHQDDLEKKDEKCVTKK